MHLAIGDVVRHRGSGAFGTVTGIASHSSGRYVLLQASGVAKPLCARSCDLDVVARKPKPLTTRSHVATPAFFVVAFIASYFSGQQVQELGGGVHIAFPACFGTFTLSRSCRTPSAR